jgi:nucleoside-diphosphate-sugar epimerase
MPRVIVIGCGFVGLHTARLFHEAQWEAIGVTHSPESAEKLADEPFSIVACDIADARSLQIHRATLANADAAIHCASSNRGGAEEYRRVYLEGARNISHMLQPKTVVFTSSTSVYAQTDGLSVTEKSLAEPERETGKILRETEDLVLAQSGIVARLAGLYGPGRSVLLQKFFDGRAAIESDGSRIINQVHRDDAAGALFFLVRQNASSGIYNVCDDTPLTQLEVYRWLAQHFHKPLPPSGPIDPHRKRGWTSKRVSNAKLRSLGWEPRFASFQDAILFDRNLQDLARGR